MTELIARLNARITSLDVAGRGGGQVISAEEVAMAMAGAPRIQWAIALLKYAGQVAYRTEVWQWLIARAIKLSDGPPPWKKVTFAQKEALAAIVLDECVPDKRCPICKGRGVVPDDRGLEQGCECCRGKGWMRLTNEDKAQRLVVDDRNYYRTWRRRENLLRAAFSEQDYEIRKMVKEGVREDGHDDPDYK